ncbi:MAG: NAD(P)/FAD-dependent oxidoreductase, partial [Bryobacteraceae bacterium]|nr:NAD(P)/FAD-dependent oxidoreductase [Bryobacteraceae bacterium]
ATQLPKRFAERWLDVHFAAARKQVNAAVLDEGLHQWEITPAGTEGYAKAEVTAGGVSTDDLSSRTMEAREVPGLFCIGEVVDVTGHLGGFNFQWAWASAWACSQAL